MGLNTPFLEDMEPLPPTLYGLSKYFGEKLAQDWCKRLGIPLVILRYSTVLGPGVRESSKMSGPLFAWTKAAKEGEPINIFQDGNQTRDYIHINDVVSANSLALSLPKGIYNVGGGEPIKVIDIARWVKESLSSSSPLVIKGGIPTSSDPQIMFSNISKLQGFGWLPKFSPKEAVNAFALSQI
jgi:nucleoside-diphosphate-sugar epimerase